MKTSYLLAVALLSIVRVAVAETSGNWPEFRGPTGQGIATEASPPIEWGPDKNISWKQAIPGQGWSSPSVYDGAIYLTTALEDGDGNLTSLRALRVDASAGTIRWDVEVFPWSGRAQKHTKNGYASPTPIVADGRVYVHYGPMGTACLDLDGTIIWRQAEVTYDTPHGSGGSPVLWGDKLIYSCDDSETPFVVALNRDTGAIVWKTARETSASKKFSFCTPLVIDDHGRTVVVSPGSGTVAAYGVDDGAEVWRVGYGEGFSIVPRPVLAHGLVFVATGFIRPCSVYAIRTGGQGDVSGTHVAWTSEEDSPHTPSMLAVGDELYYVSDRGVFSCVDVKTGQVHWREDVGGRFSASPVYADGRIYVPNEDGTTVVIAAGTRFSKLAENPLGERTFASPASVGKALFIRTEGNLYRIEAP